jgi:hypothetical protein
MKRKMRKRGRTNNTWKDKEKRKRKLRYTKRIKNSGIKRSVRIRIKRTRGKS